MNSRLFMDFTIFFDLIRSHQTRLLVRGQEGKENSQIWKCLLSLDGLESQINSANSSLVAPLNISEASEKTWSAKESERLSTFGTNSNVSTREKSRRYINAMLNVVCNFIYGDFPWPDVELLEKTRLYYKAVSKFTSCKQI